jgi:putative oxidoreductase
MLSGLFVASSYGQPRAARPTIRSYSSAALQNGGVFFDRSRLFPEAVTRYDLEEWRPRALSVLRIIAGLMIIEHGMAKLLGWPVVPAFAKLQLFSQLGAAGCIELIGGALVTVGLFTQPVAFILSGEMAVAYFMVHAPKGFYPLLNGGTLAIMYCFAFLYLSTAGAGPWSLDAAMKKS